MSDWDLYQQDCLEAYNAKYAESRSLTDPENLVEFSENGSAYPHGIGGTNYIPNAVMTFAKWKENQSPCLDAHGDEG